MRQRMKVRRRGTVVPAWKWRPMWRPEAERRKEADRRLAGQVVDQATPDQRGVRRWMQLCLTCSFFLAFVQGALT